MIPGLGSSKCRHDLDVEFFAETLDYVRKFEGLCDGCDRIYCQRVLLKRTSTFGSKDMSLDRFRRSAMPVYSP